MSAAPDCTLDRVQLETQIQRYRRLGRHATGVDRSSREVVVSFGSDLPVGLLARTLEVERGCCPFIHTAYDPARRELKLTVEGIDHVPRLDSLLDAFNATRCCTPATLSTCCEPDEKDACCGSPAGGVPSSCGCRQ